jgi:hypothetical protein
MPAHSLLPDLVRDSKIETQDLKTCLQHVFYETGRSVQQRRIRREERWVRQAKVDHGAYGAVYLEKCDLGSKTKLRAVKVINKHLNSGQELNYIQELEAVARFSHEKMIMPHSHVRLVPLLIDASIRIVLCALTAGLRLGIQYLLRWSILNTET